jgi:transposase
MDKLKIRNIDHLGIIAGIIDQIGLVEIVNQEIGENSQEKISAGIVVKAMILNGLGFVSAPLYLFSKFFEGKAIEHLLGEGIKAKDLNDDKLGRILDKLYKAGLTQLFIKIALAAVKIFSVEMKNLHLDSSSLSVEGEYLEKGGIEEGILKITHGYSRDKRPDLKQFMIDLICSGDGDIPLYFRVGDGNESDQKIFAQIIKEYKKGWQIEALFVADAALYSEENIQILGETSWLSRVSSTLNEALSLKQELNEAAFKDSEREGYRLAELCSWYAGIPQRWLVVESSERKKADLKKLDKKIEKAFQNAEKELEKFKKIDFACEADVLLTAERWNQKLPFHSLTNLVVVAHPYFRQSGRPKKGAIPDGYHYRLSAQLEQPQEKVDLARLQAGRFILATNVLESKTLTDEQILSEYKAQQSTERGFRFLKDPLFFASSVFLKTPRRIAALAMVMALCLLVYTLAQRTLRQSLAQQGQTVLNQLGKPTATPTIRWIFQCFQSIYSVFFDDIHQISNLTPEHQHILSFLGSSCQKYYLLC